VLRGDAMDLPSNEWTSYLNPKTGEIVTVTEEDRFLVGDETAISR